MTGCFMKPPEDRDRSDDDAAGWSGLADHVGRLVVADEERGPLAMQLVASGISARAMRRMRRSTCVARSASQVVAAKMDH